MNQQYIATHKPTIQHSNIYTCVHYDKGLCIKRNSSCNPLSAGCSKHSWSGSKRIIESTHLPLIEPKESKSNYEEMPIHSLHTEMLVLLASKQCLKNNHKLQTVTAILRTISKHNSSIDEIRTLAYYCPICNEYFLLKKDYKRIKSNYILLCPVLDKTLDRKPSNPEFYYDNESRIHMLGYNVNKTNNYTAKQRQLILANIIENHNISKYEILALIDANILTHEYRDGYEDAVSKWNADRFYVYRYKLGDCPEIIVDKLTIGRK